MSYSQAISLPSKTLSFAQVTTKGTWDDNYVGQAILSQTESKAASSANSLQTEEQAAAQIETNFQEQVIKNKITSMKEEVSLFSKTLDRAHWQAALDMKKELEETVKTPVDELRINTKELLEQGFQFPNVATYDNVVAQLTDVQNVQDNLN